MEDGKTNAAAVLQPGILQALIKSHASNEYIQQLTEFDEPRPVTHILTVSKLVKNIKISNHITPEDAFEILWQADKKHRGNYLYVLCVVLFLVNKVFITFHFIFHNLCASIELVLMLHRGLII